MSEPMTEQQLAEIEGQHTRADNPNYCTYDGARMPCDTLRLVAEVRWMRQVFDTTILTSRERLVFDQRQRGRPLAEIGKELGTTREWARQLEARAAQKIRRAGVSRA